MRLSGGLVWLRMVAEPALGPRQTVRLSPTPRPQLPPGNTGTSSNTRSRHPRCRVGVDPGPLPFLPPVLPPTPPPLCSAPTKDSALPTDLSTPFSAGRMTANHHRQSVSSSSAWSSSTTIQDMELRQRDVGPRSSRDLESSCKPPHPVLSQSAHELTGSQPLRPRSRRRRCTSGASRRSACDWTYKRLTR